LGSQQAGVLNVFSKQLINVSLPELRRDEKRRENLYFLHPLPPPHFTFSFE
jgi:hypothetical protein